MSWPRHPSRCVPASAAGQAAQTMGAGRGKFAEAASHHHWAAEVAVTLADCCSDQAWKRCPAQRADPCHPAALVQILAAQEARVRRAIAVSPAMQSKYDSKVECS